MAHILGSELFVTLPAPGIPARGSSASSQQHSVASVGSPHVHEEPKISGKQGLDNVDYR